MDNNFQKMVFALMALFVAMGFQNCSRVKLHAIEGFTIENVQADSSEQSK